jgi:hypothetical protein
MRRNGKQQVFDDADAEIHAFHIGDGAVNPRVTSLTNLCPANNTIALIITGAGSGSVEDLRDTIDEGFLPLQY